MNDEGHFGLAGQSVLVTGVSGGVGKALAARLGQVGAVVRGLTRRPIELVKPCGLSPVEIVRGDLLNRSSIDAALSDIDIVIHLASHAPPGSTIDPYNAEHHWEVTVIGTGILLDAARDAGVKRFVYLSSVKAMGEGTTNVIRPVDETDPCRPSTVYGRAKREAERMVLASGQTGALHAAVVRVPMVYGMNNVGNIARMVAAIKRRGFPPWPTRRNRRSAIHVADVVTALLLCCSQPNARNKVYLATDGTAYSTRWIYEEACRACGREPPAWGVPSAVLMMAAAMGTWVQRSTRRPVAFDLETMDKLASDAWYDSSRISRDLGFSASRDLASEIHRLAAFVDQ